MDTLTYFASQSPMTDPGAHGEQFAAMPNAVSEICGVIQSLLLNHEERYKYPIVNERFLCTNARYVSSVIDWILKLTKSKAPLVEGREIPDRFTASSSDYANMFVSIARSKGIPARKRVGFAGGKSCDVAEYWDGSAWKQIDPSGLIEGEYVSAVDAWMDCRAGKADPAQFTCDSNSKPAGWDALRANLILDLAAMNKIELLNWDRYGWMLRPISDMSDKAWDILDKAAEVLKNADADLEAVQALYEAQEGLQVPRVITCDNPLVPPHKVELTF